jgi:ACS family tartrate transporter-like MFS transporter
MIGKQFDGMVVRVAMIPPVQHAGQPVTLRGRSSRIAAAQRLYRAYQMYDKDNPRSVGCLASDAGAGRMSEQRIFAKCTWRLIPFAMILFVVNYVDRTNVGFAALTMNKDLGFSPATYGFGASVFFISYVFFQVPANLILQRIGARRWMFLILAAWSLISASNAFVYDPASFYVLRFLLGIAEAGFFPGMLYYLTRWFPQAYLARNVAGFEAALPLSFVVGGPLASLILGLDGTLGLHGWQWLFLGEGVPAFLLAFAVLKFLPDGPADAPWLTDAEKALIASRLAAEDVAERRAFWPVLRDFRVIGFGVALIGILTGFYGIGFWIPQIVQAMGFSTRMTGLVVAIPYLTAAVAMVIWARSSDRRGERLWHIVLPILLAAMGFAAASVVQSNFIILVALTCTAVGVLCVFAPLNGLFKSCLSGAAVASGVALCNSIGNLGGFLGPYLIGAIKETTGSYASSMTVIATGLIISAVMLFLLGRKVAAQAITMPTKAAIPA